ncbi:hypothetical protein JTE90_010408 [Oedothorax gibbosus]|uniref:Hyaluronan/mRNA-binding protein domain-containing protein n=1 Tax=Oedothorax gibbosus TaxID=931172 RepID=A0AAV6VZQ3_9ARAC|nr:hypothetical protein JTE90_010408 [Oedothorax gibbosus]
MENAYGIGVKNRYELFYDEDVDPLEIIRQQEEEKEKRKTDKSLPKDKTKNTKSKKVLPAAGVTKKAKENLEGIQTKPSENTDTSNKPRSRPFTDRTARNVRNFDESKSLEERKNFRNREDRGPSNTENRERDSENRRGRGGFRGRGRGRGRGGFFNSFENRPPRYSGAGAGGDRTSFRPFEKKDATESNNWSDMKNEFNTHKKEPESTWMDDDLTAANGKPQNDTNWGEILEEPKVANLPKDGLDDKVDALNLNNETKENLPEEHTDENSKEMTLDEWKREQEAKRAVPKYNLRKPGEGEDGNQWKRVYVLKKKAEKGADDDDEEEEDEDVRNHEFYGTY